MPATGASVSVALTFKSSAAGLGRRPLGRFALVADVVTSGAEVPMGMNDVAGTGTIAEAEGVGDGWMGVAGSGVIVLTDDAGVNGVATAADTDGVKMGFYRGRGRGWGNGRQRRRGSFSRGRAILGCGRRFC